jgi:predicted transcriptional regulator
MKILNRKIRRNIDIIANILEISKDGAKKTRIMQLAYLSFYQLSKYLKLLKDNGLLEYNPNEKNYRTTSKGIELLKNIYELKEIEEKFKEKLKIIGGMIKL